MQSAVFPAPSTRPPASRHRDRLRGLPAARDRRLGPVVGLLAAPPPPRFPDEDDGFEVAERTVPPGTWIACLAVCVAILLVGLVFT